MRPLTTRLRTACATWLLSLLLLTPSAALQAQFTYVTNNGTITITGLTNIYYYGAVVIPDLLPDPTYGLPVTSIGDHAFDECFNLSSVTIGTNVTSIGDFAFAGCSELASVTIPQSLTSIGGGAFFDCFKLLNVTLGSSLTNIGTSAFWDCTSLTNLTIPRSVADIGNGAFDGCSSLTAITVDSLNSFYSSVAGVLFNKSQTTLIKCPEGKTGACSIPDSVTNLGDWAFVSCVRLRNVTLGSSVTNLGNWAFYSCKNLTNVTIPDSVISIGDAAFAQCTSLTSATIPNSVASIGNYGFEDCTSLTTVTLGSSVTNIGKGSFSRCTSLIRVLCVGNAPSIGSDVFGSDNNATVYYLPGTSGWAATFGGLPALLWNPQVQTSAASFGVRTNRFGFTITGDSRLVIVVEACTSLANPVWIALGTNTLTGGSSYFSDRRWTNHPSRFYRLRSP